MCVIAIYKNSYPKIEDLTRMENANPHGIGIAFSKNGYSYFLKNLSLDETYKLTKKLELPFVIHFRFATVCETKIYTHPFIVSKSSSLSNYGKTKLPLLFHNGHYSYFKKDLEKIGIYKEMSDSRAIAILCAYYGIDFLKKLTKQNKFCVLYPNKIEIYGEFFLYKENLYSNLHWKMP